jgi:DNA end-binding protein Ku
LAIGQVVLSGREELVALKPVDKGLLMTTLRYPAEIRQAASYFDELADVKVDDGQIALARQLIENKASEFNPAGFTDRYQAALLEMIKAKLNGAQPVQVKPAALGQVINVMDALKQSAEPLLEAGSTTVSEGQVLLDHFLTPGLWVFRDCAL